MKHSILPYEYWIWQAAKQRCINPSNVAYQDYGAKGIDMCERWANSFEEFIKDMGPKPSKDLTLERIDNNEGYYPWNCIWATRTVQNRNRNKEYGKTRPRDRDGRFI
jgi:hypothetical protein